MSKRKKARKSTTPSNKLHKIASTMSIVPLVAMSPFLFSNNSYAIATDVTHGVTLDLSKTTTGFMSINANNYFSGLSSPYLIESSSQSIITVEYSSGNGQGTIHGNRPGTATITVNGSDGQEGTIHNSFTVAVIDPGIVIKALDSGHDGLDVGDIVRAISTHNTAADMNGDGNEDNYDYPELLSLIQPVSNHNPDFKTGITQLPTVTLALGHTDTILNLNNYFTDLDNDSLKFRFYDNAPATTPAVYAQYSSSSAMELILNPNLGGLDLNHNGSTTYTIVVDDAYGGYKVADLKVNVLDSGNHTVQVSTNPLSDLVLNGNSGYDLNQLFFDPDYDYINYSFISVPMQVNANAHASGSYLSFDSGGTDLSTVAGTVYANDSYTPGTQAFRDLKVQLTTQQFHVNESKNLSLSNFFIGTNSYSVIKPDDQTNASVDIILSSGSPELKIIGKHEGTFTFTIHSTDSSNQVMDKTFLFYINGLT
jgi:hypothetical protein